MNEITALLGKHYQLTSSQISENLKITAREVISLLVKLEKEGDLVQRNGFWSLSEETRLNQSLSGKIFGIIQEWGEISASEIAFITGVRDSLITQFLAKSVKEDLICRNRKDNMYLYVMKK